MSKSAYLNLSVFPVAISYGNLPNLEVLFGRSEKEVEIAKRIEVAEKVAIIFDRFVVAS